MAINTLPLLQVMTVGSDLASGTQTRGTYVQGVIPGGGVDGAALYVVPLVNSGTGFGVQLVGLQDNSDNVAPLSGTNNSYQGAVARLTGFDPVSQDWDRLRTLLDSADAQANLAIGLLATVARNQGFNGATWDRLRALSDNADAQAAATLGALLTLARAQGWNGATWDRLRTLSAANLIAQTGGGGLIAAGPGEWTANDAPAAGVRATATRAAGGAGVRHVCTTVSGAFQNLVGAVEAGELQLRDGATGAGAILWRCRWINGVSPIFPGRLNIVGSANTAMTIEFVAAPTNVANTQSVAMTGYSVS